ncbi:MAG: oligosaccharide repeat unit polymerase [Prevotella sp.]|nr:oligosaccharide repeat unit polymerase [Prevotella sp.]
MSRISLYIILIISFIFSVFVDTSFYDEVSEMILFCIAGMVFVSFLFYKDTNEIISRIYFRPIHLFLFAYAVVSFQIPLDMLLGYPVDDFTIGNLNITPKAVRVALWGLIAFIAGYIIKKNDGVIAHTNKHTNKYASITIFKILSSLMVILMLVFIPTSLLFGGYATSALAESGFSYLSSWSIVFFSSFFIQYTINAKIENKGKEWNIKDLVKDIGWWQNINLVLYILIILNIGDRGPMILLMMAYYLVYLTVTGICPSKRTLIIGIMAGVIFFSFLGYTKKFRDNNTIFERISMTVESNPYEEVEESILPSTLELAGSYMCLAYSIEDMQISKNYGYGKYQITYILSCIPFVASFLNLPKPTSTYITHLIQGDLPSYGNGTSITADFYLDGGVLGVVLGMFIFGYFFRRFEMVLFSKEDTSLLLYCIAFYFSIHCIYIPRSFLLLSLKYSVWMAVVIYLNQLRYNRNIK